MRPATTKAAKNHSQANTTKTGEKQKQQYFEKIVQSQEVCFETLIKKIDVLVKASIEGNEIKKKMLRINQKTYELKKKKFEEKKKINCEKLKLTMQKLEIKKRKLDAQLNYL